LRVSQLKRLIRLQEQHVNIGISKVLTHQMNWHQDIYDDQGLECKNRPKPIVVT
jgi:hypothetical protein